MICIFYKTTDCFHLGQPKTWRKENNFDKWLIMNSYLFLLRKTHCLQISKKLFVKKLSIFIIFHHSEINILDYYLEKISNCLGRIWFLLWHRDFLFLQNDGLRNCLRGIWSFSLGERPLSSKWWINEFW